MWWLASTSIATLRAHLTVAQFWALEAVVILGLGIAVVEGRRLWRKRSPGHAPRAIAVGLVALALSVALPPATNRIYYDELLYQSIGQNLADLRLAQMCNDGVVEYGRLQCQAGEYNKQPYAYPHLLSVAFRLVGVGDGVAPVVNVLASVVTVVAVYFIVWLRFADAMAAGLAALVLALTPEQILWSVTAAVEPTTAMALSLAMLAAVHFARTRSTTALAGVVVGCAWAAQFRAEAVLVIPAVAVVLAQGARDEFARPRLWWGALAGLLLLSVHLGHMVAVRDEGWGTTNARLSLQYVAENLRVNGGFFAGDARFPVAYTALAIVGVVRGGAAALPFVLAFGLFFGIHLLFYAGSYNYGADVRYSLTTFPWVAVLAGLGGAKVAAVLPARLPRGLVGAGLVLQFSWYAPLVRATTDEAWAGRADVAFARSAAPTLRGNQFVLTHNPGMFHLWGVNAGQMSLASGNPTFVNYLATRFARGVYLHWNFWCNASDDTQRGVCVRAAAAHPLQQVARWDERDHRYRLYRYRVTAASPVPTPDSSSALDLPPGSVP